MKPSPKDKIYDYVIRTEFDCNLKGDVFLTPFEIFNLFLSITVQTVVLDPKLNNGKTIHIKFNCMNSEKVEIIDSASALDYGSYTLASHFLDSDVTNSAKNRFKKIDVLNPDERIGEKEKKKKKEEPKTNKIHE